MHGVVAFLVALAIMILAAIGAILVHYNLHGEGFGESLGLGVGVFALAGAFMLYRGFFWREQAGRRGDAVP